MQKCSSVYTLTSTCKYPISSQSWHFVRTRRSFLMLTAWNRRYNVSEWQRCTAWGIVTAWMLSEPRLDSSLKIALLELSHSVWTWSRARLINPPTCKRPRNLVGETGSKIAKFWIRRTNNFRESSSPHRSSTRFVFPLPNYPLPPVSSPHVTSRWSIQSPSNLISSTWTRVPSSWASSVIDPVPLAVAVVH